MKSISKLVLVAAGLMTASIYADLPENHDCLKVTDPSGHNPAAIITGVHVTMIDPSTKTYSLHSMQGQGEGAQCDTKVYVGCTTNAGDSGLSNCKNIRNQVNQVKKTCSQQDEEDPIGFFHITFSQATSRVDSQGNTIQTATVIPSLLDGKGNYTFQSTYHGKLIYETDADGKIIFVQCPTVTATKNQ